jgi:hypothetical protein
VIGAHREVTQARRTLIQVLRDLRQYRRDAIIVVGAQAVYLRTQSVSLPFALFTRDADLALDPRILDREPPLRITLAVAGYTPRDRQPGLYWAPGREEHDGAQVDLLVQEDFASPGGRRDARLPGDNRNVARRVRGLEASLYDRDLLQIRDFDDPSAGIEALVAGPAALILAKAQKIVERDSGTPERVKPKDVADVFALLRAHEPGELERRFGMLAVQPEIAGALAAGVSAVQEVFGKARGRALFADTLSGIAERAELLASYEALTRELLTIVTRVAGR